MRVFFLFQMSLCKDKKFCNINMYFITAEDKSNSLPADLILKATPNLLYTHLNPYIQLLIPI